MRTASTLSAVLICAPAFGVEDLTTPEGGVPDDSAPEVSDAPEATDLPQSEWGRLESDRQVAPQSHQPAGRAMRGERPGPDDAAWHREIQIRYEPSQATFTKQVDAAVAARMCPTSSTARRLVVVTDEDLSRPAAKRQRVYVKTACDIAATLERGNDE